MANKANSTPSTGKMNVKRAYAGVDAKRPAPRQSLAATHPSNYAQATNKTMPPPQPPLPKARKVSFAELGKTAAHKTGNQLRLSNGYPTPAASPEETAEDDATAQNSINQPLSLSPSSRRTSTSCPLDLPSPQTKSPSAKVERPWEAHNDPTVIHPSASRCDSPYLTQLQFTTSDRPPLWWRNGTVLRSDTELSNGAISPTHMIGLPFGSMVEMAHYYPPEEAFNRLK